MRAYQGNLGIGVDLPTNPSSTLTVDGIISAVGNRIVDVASPIAGTDAANKSYVDAQTGGGGSGAIITLFGVSSNSPSPTSHTRSGGSVQTCVRGYAGQSSCSTSTPAPVAAGTGTPACSSLGEGWNEVISGYGPLNTLYVWYGSAGWPPDEVQTPERAVGLTDSVCSTAPFAFVRDIQFSGSQSQVANTQSVISACTPDHCNTCRICIKSE